MAGSAHAETARCRRAEYPYMQLQVFACSRLIHKPPQIVLDRQNYERLKGEMAKCIGHPIPPWEVLKLCGIPVVPATAIPKGKEIST